MKRLLFALAVWLLVPLQAFSTERAVTGQIIEFYVVDSVTGTPKTGDAANLTAYYSADGGAATALNDTSATEVSSTNAPGVYQFTLNLAAESTGKNIAYTCKSSTSGIYAYPRFVAITPANFSLTAINSSGYGILQDASITTAKFSAGAIDANAIGADAITAAKVANGTIDAATFAASAIDATAIATDAITNTKIAPSAIGSSELASGCITSSQIANDAIDANEIADGSLGPAEFGAGFIINTSFAAGAIDAGAIATDAIGSAEISAAAVTKIANGGPVLYTGTISAIDSQTVYSIPAVGTGTATLAAGQVIAVYDTSSSSTMPSIRAVTSFDSSTGKVTVSSAPDFTVAAGDVVRIYPQHTGIASMAAKLPSKSYLAGSNNSDGDVQLDEATGALPLNSITSTSIAAGAIASGKFGAGAIDSTAIAANAIGASQIAASAIGSSELASGCITSSQIANDAIDVNEIADGSLVASKFGASAIDANAIADNAIDAGALAANAITSAKIATDAIGASQVAADGVRKINGLMGTGTITSVSTGVIVNFGEGYDGSQLAGQIIVMIDSAGVKTSSRTITGGSVGSVNLDAAYESWAGTGDFYAIIPASTYINTIKAKLPSKTYLTGSNNSDGDVQLDEATGALPLNSITATSIADNSIDAGAIASDAIGSTEIANGAIDNLAFAAGAIDATAIAANAIGSSQIAASAITSGKFASSAITSTVIANDAITANKIQDGSIQSSKFAAGAIDASAIAADAIGASEIANGAIDNLAFAAGAIDASAIATDAIGSAEIAASAIGSSELATGALTSDEVSASYLQSFINVDTGITSASAVEGSVAKELADMMTAAFNSSVIELDPSLLDQMADAVWNEAVAGHTTAGTFGVQVYTKIDSILDDTGTSGVAIADSAITNAKFTTGAIDANAIADNAIDAGAIAADAIGSSEIATNAITSAELDATAASEIGAAVWDQATAGHVAAGTFGEQVKTDGDTVETRVSTLYTDWINGGRLDNLLDAVATQSSLTTVGSNVTSIKGVTDKLDTAMELDGSVYRFTSNALELGAAGGLTTSAIADAVWDEAQSGHTTAGTFGKYLDTQVSLASSGSPSVIADAVWDELRAGHVVSGSFGEGVNIKDGGIAAATIASNAITNTKIATDAIGAAQIADSAIDAGALATDTITAAKIAASAITNGKFAANAIDANAIADNAIDAGAIATDAIGATEIADNAIDANAIAANAITSAKIATDAIGAAQIGAAAIGTSEIASTVLGASFNSSTDSLEAIRDRIDVSAPVGVAGGGVLTASLADSSLSPRKRFELIKGEQKTLTFVAEASGRFSSTTPTTITVKIKDSAGTIITKNNVDVTRVTEQADLQVIRVTLTPSETASLRSGYVTVELSFDNDKAVLTTSLYIISGI